MKINKDRLSAFYQVAISKNFHTAADALCITQPALSQRVLKLEQEIETTLFIRGNDGVTLTQSGLLLLEYVRNLSSMELEVLAKISGRSNGGRCGTLRVAAYSSILRSVIMPALKPILDSSEDIHVEFFSREMRDLPSMLKTGEADFIVLDHFNDLINFNKVKIGEEEIVHARHKEHTDENQVFLDHDIQDMTTFSFFKSQGLGDVSLKRCYYDDIYGVIDGVKLGFGQAIVSRHLISDLNDIEIIPYPHIVSNPLVLYYHSNQYLTSLYQEVIDTLKNRAALFLQP
ncbi:LysR family transcriptional regulator [Shewanella woodyi]|uniref:Transcriptional regulator, LysR family n=1 Tax=Shewanella woodyi (strain ATCC 51908 / MS32) TaxID=392500 RepID=B1KQT0_SHEWM|nr:LysR family transcriptional regulator [Shewanella woodyi]ACA87686.1 transcriptional regulator, LysR family [Shewanella woodyi ATCC 51908]